MSGHHVQLKNNAKILKLSVIPVKKVFKRFGAHCYIGFDVMITESSAMKPTPLYGLFDSK